MSMWIDDVNAKHILDDKISDHNSFLYVHTKNIIDDGITLIKNAVNHELCDNFVEQYDIFTNKQYSVNRIVNFHSLNNETLDVVCNKKVDELLSFMFDKKQTIYTSLTFGMGTNQSIHRDTPHFYTNPIDKYFGVWYALEDIRIESGPLMYYLGGHKLDVPDGHQIWDEMYGDENYTFEKINNCLNKYNKIIHETCKKNNLRGINIGEITHTINKGDIIVWHPKMPHGGSNILNPGLTRKSIVTHNIPVDTAIFNAGHFFHNGKTKKYVDNVPNFKYLVHNGVKYIEHTTKPYFQTSYL